MMELSDRAQRWLTSAYGLATGMKMASQNPFSLSTNTDGCINLGVAENELMFDALAQKLAESESLRVSATELKYNNFIGLQSLRDALAVFLNRNLAIADSLAIDPSQITLHNGCGSAVESLFHVLCDPGDAVLIPSPYYGGFDMDVERRALVKVVPVDLSADNAYVLDLEALEAAFVNASAVVKSTGNKVRSLLLMNPVNPLGIIYTKQQVTDALAFCKRHALHLVMDEIYAFSIFEASAQPEFQSVLARQDMADYASHVHFLWGFSKDFCLNGIRAGLVVSRNANVINGLSELSYFSGISTLTQKFLTEMVSDVAWYESFFASNKSRLKLAHDYAVGCIQAFNKEMPSELQISHMECVAGFFLWVDLSPFLFTKDKVVAGERESLLFMRLIQEGGVYIAPGHLAFHDLRAGTFRIIFATQDEVLRLAFDRIFKVLRHICDEKWVNRI